MPVPIAFGWPVAIVTRGPWAFDRATTTPSLASGCTDSVNQYTLFASAAIELIRNCIATKLNGDVSVRPSRMMAESGAPLTARPVTQ